MMNMNFSSKQYFKTRPLAWILWLFVGAVLSWPAVPAALADIGPKPTMTFNFVYEIEPVPIIGGQLIECREPDCSDGRPLEEGGPQRFQCPTGEPNVCFAMAYGFQPYHKLIIEFADGTRESNIFQKPPFDETLTVTVQESSLVVQPTGLSAAGFVPALLATLAVELLVAALYLLLLRQPRAMLLWVLVGNLITLPIVWFLLAALPLPATLVMCSYELFAVIIEVVVLYLGGRRWGFALNHAIALSILMNLLSFLVGLIFIG